MSDDDLKRSFAWIDGIAWRLTTAVLVLWALAMLTVLWWFWWHC